ncbi:unnamed protein product [Amaranthus hypochondriacus]
MAIIKTLRQHFQNSKSKALKKLLRPEGSIFLSTTKLKWLRQCMVLVANKKRKKKEKPFKVINSVACCYGYGASLQTLEVDGPSYVDPDTYELSHDVGKATLKADVVQHCNQHLTF